MNKLLLFVFDIIKTYLLKIRLAPKTVPGHMLDYNALRLQLVVS